MLSIALRSLSPRTVYIVAGLLVVVVIAGTASALWLYRNAALASGEWHLRNIAVALSEQTRQGVLTADMATRATEEGYSRQTAAGAAVTRTLHEEMRQRVAELPQLRALVVIGPEGQLMAHSDAFSAPSVNYADRDYFAFHRDVPGAQPFLGSPLKGPVIQEWTYPLSRGVRDANGQFRGVVVAAFAISYFHDVYRALELGPHGRVFLFRKDGVLLTSFPDDTGQVGGTHSSHPMFAIALPHATAGVLRAGGFADDRPRLLAYRTLPDYPLVLAVSSTTDYVLREWRRQSLYAGAAAMAAIAFILFVSLLLTRQFRLARDLAGEVAESERRWLAATEAAGHGVWEWDVASARTVRSTQYHRMLGYADGEISEGREGWLQLVHPEDSKAVHQVNQSLLERRTEQFSTQIRLRCKNGSWMWVLNRGVVVSRDAQGRALRVLGTITDVTESQRAQELLRDSEARLNAIIGSAMDAIITVDEKQNIVLFNAAAERIFGCPSRDAVGGPLDRFLPERFRAAHRAHIERFGETGVTMRRMGENVVLVGLRADGEEFPIDASISQVEVGGRRFYTVILRDITERQKSAADLQESHRELRELYRVVHEVREAERVRIARELHDELAQWLTALKMDVSWIAARLPRDLTRLTEKTTKMKEVVDTTVAAVRRIAADLRPVMIDDLGLIPAIEHLLHEFSQRSGILVTLDARTDAVEFRDPVATAVYRMVQEALTNVARHAEASRVEVSLVLEGERLIVTVRDDGRGIEEAATRKGKSYGVLGIRERAQTLGGSARIYRGAESGTTVEITIPLRAQQHGEVAA